MSETRQYCTFHLQEEYFGIDVRHVQEVLRGPTLTRVPLAPGTVHGLMNLRGQIVTALDLRHRLGMPSRGEGESPMNVVVKTDDGPVSLLVDSIGDVVEFREQDSEPPPHTLRDEWRELIVAALQLPDRLLLILDTEQAVQLPRAAER